MKIFKSPILISFLLVLLTFSSFSCEKQNPNRVYFSIDEKDRKIIIPVKLNDTLSAKMIFDTGWHIGGFALDSVFYHSHFKPDNHTSIPLEIHSGWSRDLSANSVIHNKHHNVEVGKTKLSYDYINVFDWHKYTNNSTSDGVFNIPQNDTTHIWEINFEHNYIEIHQENEFKFPATCSFFPMSRSENRIQFPLCIRFEDDDIMEINADFLIDTAAAWDLVMNDTAEEFKYIDKREDAVWIEFMSSYFKRYPTTFLLCDNIVIDSSRLYTYDLQSRSNAPYILGLNFLKHFNVFIDIKKRQIGLERHNNYKRLVNPLYRRFYYNSPPDSDGRYIVTVMSDAKDNFFRNAGLTIGDEIVAINGLDISQITREYRHQNLEQDTLIYSIIRNKESIELLIPVDKTQEKGD